MSKSVKLTIALLLISNIVLIGFLMMNKPKPQNRKTPKDRIIKELELDENQVQSYEKLIEAHKQEMFATHKEIKELKKDLYLNLKKESPTIADSLIIKIGDKIKHIEELHFNHFKDIKALCSDKQKEKFNSIVEELEQIFVPRKGRHKRKRHEK